MERRPSILRIRKFQSWKGRSATPAERSRCTWRNLRSDSGVVEISRSTVIPVLQWGCCHEWFSRIRCAPLPSSSPCSAAIWASKCRVRVDHRGLSGEFMEHDDVCGGVSIVRYGLSSLLRGDGGSERGWEAGPRGGELQVQLRVRALGQRGWEFRDEGRLRDGERTLLRSDRGSERGWEAGSRGGEWRLEHGVRSRGPWRREIQREGGLPGGERPPLSRDRRYERGWEGGSRNCEWRF